MEWSKVKSDWSHLKTRFHTKWDRLTESDLAEISGKRTDLVSHLETRYRIDKQKAQKEVDEFVKSLK